MALTTNINPGLSELMSHGPIETEVIAEMEPTVDANPEAVPRMDASNSSRVYVFTVAHSTSTEP
eukprot:CAMPEP_0181175978 /NCGR_PEP_ID=MMETSP1096-20121128/4377_1 /TAXON_ID=156174 ORGANISM="Chrysochromulina ericina, Strain CCMP281" /NCGR_SAMPLE_ID=MMETSP1096 /ASSEMBLY_ACC=CAM_ASM_000453 /LENGTH=63 /DNA_ID=CAMNT_0023264021 /DNA_START=205 /DNA_END=396 /DNA_ORIENTATION=+